MSAGGRSFPSDAERRFHEEWLGMVQPIEGLVVSIPVLLDAQLAQRLPPEIQRGLLELCPVRAGTDRRALRDLPAFLRQLLDWTPDLLTTGSAIAPELELWVAEGRQAIRPTFVLPDRLLLGWDVADPSVAGNAGVGLDLDRAETATGPWDYPPAAKFDRLLRHGRIPLGLLTNREVVRLVYAPHGESSGHITFRVEDMATAGGRPILDAFVMLLHARRLLGVAPDKRLPALLAESRTRQANVTSDLADQVFDALAILLRGFEAAAERDGRHLLDDAVARDDDHVYRGLLAVMLRLVFVLYAEDRSLLPVEHPLYAQHMSLLALYQRLLENRGAHPDSMSRRFGAWGQLVALFRAIFLGVEHGDLSMPPRRGSLFDPHLYPFLEGWGPAGGAPIKIDADRAAVKVPSVDDETVFHVLEKLIVFEGQRLSYRTLDVEQIGSVYEALMGYHVVRVAAPAVCMRPNRVWVTAAEVMDEPAARRAAWLKETVGLSKADATKVAAALAAAPDPFEALSGYSVAGRHRDRTLALARPGQLVLQPGAERRRTSSHYTPRSLSAPIVKRTLEPLLAAMGEDFPSDLLLQLKICDPAMGSGAFLVEACRFLGDALVAAWTREGKLDRMARPGEDPVLHARRLVAQRCLYGVDKNDAAVELRSSRSGSSRWQRTSPSRSSTTRSATATPSSASTSSRSVASTGSPGSSSSFSRDVLKEALDEAIEIRKGILELADDPTPAAAREKERLVRDAHDASARARLVADVVVGAFFAGKSDKEREKERQRRVRLVEEWLAGDADAGEELEGLQGDIRGRIPVFHWMLEFPEVFYAERPDPLEGGKVNRVAFMDGFVGNPPFMGGRIISGELGDDYADWLEALHCGSKNADLCVHFFRRAAAHLGRSGTIGLIGTNTVAQGDSRNTGLQPLVREGLTIYDATRSMLWPGAAAVAVSVVHLAKGAPATQFGRRVLDAVEVPAIDSRLLPSVERGDPAALTANEGLSFQGCILAGIGFTLTPEERDALVRSDRSNAERILPYLGGEEVNSSPTQEFERYVIDFADLPLEEARRWPDLLEIVRKRVKPERDRVKRDAHREHWWHFGDKRPALRTALSTLRRCLVCSRHSKHLCFAFQATNRILSEATNVFAVASATAFGLLQSRVHEPWARLLSSSLEDRLRYSASDCFDTFPFPRPDPRTVISALESIGQGLYDTRAAYMVETNQGLTDTYNRLKDPACADAPVLALRRLHEEMDAAVLDAYGWSNIPVPPYCPLTPAEEKALEAFQDEVIDRLFLLNAERAEEEKKQGAAAAGKAKKKPAKPRSPKKSAKKAPAQAGLDFER